MKIKRYSYYCSQCREFIEKIGDAYIVDEARPQAFCSEKCIVQFHDLDIKHFETQEREVRKQLGIEKEVVGITTEDINHVIEETLDEPTTVYEDRDELGQVYYYLHSTHLIDDNEFNVVIIAKYFADKPSFIYHHVITKSEELTQYYRTGKPVRKTDEQVETVGDLKKEELILPRQVMDEVEQMRSTMVAEMIEMRGEEDISIEKFALYENYIEGTLTDPDEVFEYLDDLKRPISVNIKAYSLNKESFFYYVVCLKLNPKDVGLKEKEDVLIPILSYPSTARETYLHHQKGSATTKKSLN